MDILYDYAKSKSHIIDEKKTKAIYNGLALKISEPALTIGKRLISGLIDFTCTTKFCDLTRVTTYIASDACVGLEFTLPCVGPDLYLPTGIDWALTEEVEFIYYCIKRAERERIKSKLAKDKLDLINKYAELEASKGS